MIEGDSGELADLIPQRCSGRIGSVVVGIPLVLLPLAEQRRFIAAIEAVAPGLGFILYSYCVASPLPWRRLGLVARRKAWTPPTFRLRASGAPHLRSTRRVAAATRPVINVCDTRPPETETVFHSRDKPMIPHTSGSTPPDWPLCRSLTGWADGAGTGMPALLARHDGRTVVTDPLLWCRPIHWLCGGAVCGADLVAQSDHLGGGASLGACAGWLMDEASRQASLCESALTLCLPMPPGVPYDAALVRRAEAARDFWMPETCVLELVLSEADVAQAGADVLLALSALRDLGFGLAVECGRDSAAGLARLRRLPLTCLRLPAGVVCDLPHSRPARAAVARIVQEAHAQEAIVLAQCVHTAAQRDLLADLGCDGAQGALFGAPMPAASFQAALLRHLQE